MNNIDDISSRSKNVAMGIVSSLAIKHTLKKGSKDIICLSDNKFIKPKVLFQKIDMHRQWYGIRNASQA